MLGPTGPSCIPELTKIWLGNINNYNYTDNFYYQPTDHPTNLSLEAPKPELKNLALLSSQSKIHSLSVHSIEICANIFPWYNFYQNIWISNAEFILQMKFNFETNWISKLKFWHNYLYQMHKRDCMDWTLLHIDN